MLFIFWTIRDVRRNKSNAITLEFRKYVREFLERRGAIKKDNLLDDFPGVIHPAKDLYMINGKLVMQTENKTIDGEYKPGGYVLDLSNIGIYWLYIVTATKIIFEYEYFLDFILISWGVLLILMLIGRVVCQIAC